MASQLSLIPEKFCTKCSTVKPRTEFSERWQKGAGSKPYRASNAYCKPCTSRVVEERRQQNLEANKVAQRKSKLKNTYGLTIEDYDRMLTEQRGGCAICATTVPGGPGRFHVDHCHTTGRVRGLLCCNCNRGIGALKDDADLLRSAIAYLESRRG